MNMQGDFSADRNVGGLEDALRSALLGSTLPGEAEGLDDSEAERIVAFVIKAAAVRKPGEPVISIRSAGADTPGQRRMQLVVVNDDMPFLVDSVALTLAARQIEVHRLLHPVVSVRRDATGKLSHILDADSSGERRESIIYMNVERADARVRHALQRELEGVLADVRAAVQDWPRMQIALRDDADKLPDGEGSALLRWFLDRNFTQLGHQIEARDDSVSAALGVLRNDDPPLWSDRARAAAFAWFAEGREGPLIVKSGRLATVHRHVPMDMVITPVRDGGDITALSIHAGLWTSAALRAPSDKVPVLRTRLAALETKFGFDPQGHAGKALHHALSSLPHDLLVGFDSATLEALALNAMSIADRPRQKLMLVPSPLRRHLFAFVWLPRDEVSTARRRTIGDMLARAADAPLTGWSMELSDGPLALIRFAFDLPPDAKLPDADALDHQLAEMLRGWGPAVEAALSELLPRARATRLAISYANCFPPSYRERYDAREAALDALRLNALGGADARGARLYRAPVDDGARLRLKLYRVDGLMPLSAAVPVLENFGFAVLKEVPTRLMSDADAHIHEFLLSTDSAEAAETLLARADMAEQALAAVLEAKVENDAFNQLIVAAGLDPRGVLLFRAWFRYMRQTGLAYGIQTVVDALKRAPQAAHAIIALFDAIHDPRHGSEDAAGVADAMIDAALTKVGAIDDDRILRWLRTLVKSVLRTNAFTPAADEALAFKIESKSIPGLPAPVPWREIWIYSPRVEGIHLRGGPIARGGLRWSDRRDDFRTEILGLMKAQLVKNAVIVPTGAKGGFYPKQLPAPSDRDAWLAEGTESYRIFIRTLLSVTDNIVEGKVVHPDAVVIRDGEDPYFVVAADKGTATFSDVANAIATTRGFWLGDALASGGSQGYDHKAMGITARGAWISVQRHFAEMGVDVQSEPVRVAGCGDMSGDVFGNGMLLSRSIKLVAAFDHRHIFLDPDPDPSKSWEERARLFALPRSSWADYAANLISKGGGIFPRSQKAIPLSSEIRAVLDIAEESIDPASLISAILRSPVDLLWFGGIGTYIKSASEVNAQVGDPANDGQRVNGEDVRAKVVGEGANLGVTQAGRIEFALKGGRINTDFIDNSAGVDCSDNEVNIKIPLNREMIEGRLSFDDRNTFLREMTDDVAALVLEDNRLQTLALSLAERGGSHALPAQLRVIEMLEGQGRINRKVDGLADNEHLLRRVQDKRGLTRPELAVLLSHSKLALQATIEASALPQDPLLVPMLVQAFPPAMQARFADAIDAHRLREEIIATKLANRIVNRLGFLIPIELAEEEGASFAAIAGAYVAADAIFDIQQLWEAIEAAQVNEGGRLDLFAAAATAVRLHMADLLRVMQDGVTPSQIVAQVRDGVGQLDAALAELLRQEAAGEADTIRTHLGRSGADETIIGRIVRLHELDGAIGNAALAKASGIDVIAVTRAYVRLGEVLGLDWARVMLRRLQPADSWEKLLVAGLGRDFEQLRLDFLGRIEAHDLQAGVETWIKAHAARVAQFRTLVDRARAAPAPSAAMLAQIAGQARVLLGR